ncbi:DUF1488 family protein [Bradyrhizobium yuanmingense]|uniref:DUF1488 family protein n=1 Tax=Bradyrhizobium yuanmingense TaxID=108015 RepID=UPI0012FD1EF0|nr:DUF1488 family protein [Bradyrhizobium yuanmingense]
MPLSPGPSGDFEATPDAVLFAMFDGSDRIVCKVELSALRDRASAEEADPNDVIATFMKHRATIEQIASELYDAGKEMPVVWGGVPDARRADLSSRYLTHSRPAPRAFATQYSHPQ